MNAKIISFKDPSFASGLLQSEIDEFVAFGKMTPAEQDADLAAYRERQTKLFPPPENNFSEKEAIALANSRIKQALSEGVAASTDFLDLDSPFDAKYPFRVIEAKEFAGGVFVEPEWQVHQLVPKLGTGLDLGASKSWKSFKVLEVATCIHRGTPYNDRAVRKGRSVIVVAEGAYGYPLRMKALAKHLKCDISELPAVIPAAPNLFMPEQVDALIRELKKRGATYVVIDTKWRCSVGAEENSASDSAVVFGAMERISQEVGCFVTAISHTGLSDGTRVRGSSSQFAAVDVEVLHERVGDIGTSTITKLKDGPDGAVWSCKMKTIPLSDKTDSLVVEHMEHVAPKVVTKRLSGFALTVHDTLRTLAPTGSCLYEDLVDAVKRKMPPPEGDKRDLRRDYINRAIDTKLVPVGHVYMHGEDRISLTNILTEGDL